MFKMFSDVLHIDCTADTNHEDRPFLTITGRDSNGKMFTILRAFLPNERAWVFRWLFQMVMPTLLGKEYIARVKVIVTDGDSQERSQLDIAIALHYRDVCRVRCGWHVVDRGWNRVCPGVRSVSRGNEKAFKAICIEIKNWLYSWMQASCETEAEYKISKALLAAYLCHSTFVNIATEPGADRIRTYICLDTQSQCSDKGYLHINSYCYCRFKSDSLVKALDVTETDSERGGSGD
jgi:hypothetical protein